MNKLRMLVTLLCILPALPLAHSAVAAADTATATPSSSVTAYRYDPGHTGYTPDTLTTPLSLLWRHTTTAATNSPASPLYANATIYFGAGKHVYAVRAADGGTVWQYPTDESAVGNFNTTPTLDNGFLYLGSDDTYLYKINAKTGEMVWSKKVDGAIRGAPVVDAGIVYFGSADNHCYAARADTGDTVWDFATSGPVTTAPALSDTQVFFASADNSIYCLAKTSGHKIWSVVMPSDPTTASQVYAEGILYAVAGNTLYAFSTQTGATRWSKQLSADITTPATVGPGFVGVGTLDGTVSVFNRQGRLRWQKSLRYPSFGAPLLAGSTFLVPGQHGVLYALQADTGNLTWEYVVPDSTTKKVARPVFTNVTSSPVLADGALYVLSNDGTLSALRTDALATLPPQVSKMVPAPGGTVPGVNVYPSATVTAEGSGINPTTVSLQLDGQAVPHVYFDASKSQVVVDTSSPDSPAKLSDGAHQVVVKATDWRGNTVTRTWGFFVDNSYNPQTENVTPTADTNAGTR